MTFGNESRDQFEHRAIVGLWANVSLLTDGADLDPALSSALEGEPVAAPGSEAKYAKRRSKGRNVDTRHPAPSYSYIGDRQAAPAFINHNNRNPSDEQELTRARPTHEYATAIPARSLKRLDRGKPRDRAHIPTS